MQKKFRVLCKKNHGAKIERLIMTNKKNLCKYYEISVQILQFFAFFAIKRCGKWDVLLHFMQHPALHKDLRVIYKQVFFQSHRDVKHQVRIKMLLF